VEREKDNGLLNFQGELDIPWRSDSYGYEIGKCVTTMRLDNKVSSTKHFQTLGLKGELSMATFSKCSM
jgi:hypothetical protein